jgi:hypothetical protein
LFPLGVFENDKSSQNVGPLFNTAKVVYYFLEKNVLGNILGDFFTNSSGRPDF